MDDVIACAAFDVIIARAAVDAVIAAIAGQEVVPIVTNERVVAVAAEDILDVYDRVGIAPAIDGGAEPEIDRNGAFFEILEVDLIDAVSAVDAVRAIAATENFVARAADQGIGKGGAGHGFDTRDRVGVTEAVNRDAREKVDVDAVRAALFVVVDHIQNVAIDAVRATIDAVIARAADDEIGTSAAKQRVVAFAAEQRVIAALTDKLVVADTAIEGLVLIRADPCVVIGGGDERRWKHGAEIQRGAGREGAAADRQHADDLILKRSNARGIGRQGVCGIGTCQNEHMIDAGRHIENAHDRQRNVGSIIAIGVQEHVDDVQLVVLIFAIRADENR